MISLHRKLALRAQASLAQGTERSIAALARTTQAAHSTVAVGDADVPLVDTVQDARDAAEILPWLEDDTSLAGDDAWEAWDQSDYAIELSGRLETELGEAKVELDQALEDAAQALADAGLARSEAAQAVADAQVAAANAGTALDEALAAAQAASEASVQAQLADGRLVLSDAAPVAADGSGKPIGALWMRKAAGAVTAMWEWTALGWVSRPLAEQIIPKVAIGEGTYGDLDGVRLTARSIVADKLTVGGGQNEVWDPSYTAYNTAAWGNPTGGPGTGWVTDVVRPGGVVSQKLTERTAPASTAALYSAQRAAVNIPSGVNTDRLIYVGDRVGQKITAYSNWLVDKAPPAGMTSISTQVYFYNAAGANFSNQSAGSIARAEVVAGEWMRVGGKQLTVPAGALYAITRPTVYYTNNTTQVNGANYYLGGEEMYWANAGELIVDGGILAQHVAALAITAEKIAAEAVTAVKIAAGAVLAEKIAASAITTDKLFALAVTAEKIAAGAIIADKIAAGAITTTKLAATAIDGMTITGALIRTAPSGQRLQLDANGLRAFNAAGSVTATLNSVDGGMALAGGLYVNSSLLGLPREIGLWNGTIQSSLTHVVSGQTKLDLLRLELGPNGASLISERFLGSGEGQPLTISAPKILMSGPVEFRGDTEWVEAAAETGSGTVMWRCKNDVVYVQWRGAVNAANGATNLKTAFIPPAYRPVQNQRGSGALNGNAAAGLYVTMEGNVGIINSTGSAKTGGEGTCIYVL